MKKISTLIVAFAVLVTSGVANTECVFLMHQPQLPESAKKLTK